MWSHETSLRLSSSPLKSPLVEEGGEPPREPSSSSSAPDVGLWVGGRTLPSIRPKESKTRATLFISFSFLLIIRVEAISLRPTSIFQYERFMFHDVWGECGVSVSRLSNVKMFSFFSYKIGQLICKLIQRQIISQKKFTVGLFEILNIQGFVFVIFGLDQGNAAMNNYAKFKRNY